MNTETEDINLFFDDPTHNRVGQSKHGTLWVLRREVDFCMQIDRQKNEPREWPGGPRALWAGAVTIMAGIDLLSKFYEGHEDTSVGGRFCRFLERFFSLDDKDSKLIYQLRNSLVHSFSLGFKVDGQDIGLRFKEHSGLITNDATLKIVDLWVLYQQFEKSVFAYRSILEDNAEVRLHFGKMFSKFGTMYLSTSQPVVTMTTTTLSSPHSQPSQILLPQTSTGAPVGHRF